MTTIAAATFVMPHYATDAMTATFTERGIASLYAQTDANWRLVVVDDASVYRPALDRLTELRDSDPHRIELMPQTVNRGQGACRNIGVRRAVEQGADIILFQDADDVAHPRRLELSRRLFAERPEVDFVYSSFTVVDEHERPVPTNRLTPSIVEILESHADPAEGRDVWIRIGTELGYTTLTSTVAVRSRLALDQPFPEVRGCEDAHAWLRMSAAGASFGFVRDCRAGYRIPRSVRGSADRVRLGDEYYRRKAEVETDGFDRALVLAVGRGVVDRATASDLRRAFLERLAATLAREGRDDLANEIRAEAPANQHGDVGPFATALQPRGPESHPWR
jgi:glycosyltransferase involved in cell wall biosynthesis